MLISVKEVADQLKISERGVQLKCKKYGVKKIGNQYQITQSILDEWLTDTPETNTETKRTPNTKKIDTSRTNTKKRTSFTSFYIAGLLLFIFIATAVVYWDLKTEISEHKTTIKENDTQHRQAVNSLQKKLNDAVDVIHNQELEIQMLKYKDSIKAFSKH
jgi:uncharacterized protein HemX